MYINMKKIYRYGVLMVIGLSFIFYGIINAVIVDHSYDEPTDAEIIERAKGLGMIGIEEQMLKDLQEDE